MFSHFEFSVSHPWVPFLLAIGALGLAIYTYQAVPASKPLKVVFIMLRSTALFLTFLLILEPALSSVYSRKQSPGLAILADDSESMTIRDGALGRDSTLIRLLTTNRDSLSKLGDVNTFLFGKSVISKPLESLSFRQKQTDISEAIKTLTSAKGERKPNAILLISDGQFTSGENPIYTAESSSIPVYTVLIGDTTKKRDVALNKVIAPASAFTNTKVPVSVILSQKGFTNQAAKLVLSGEKGTLSEKVVPLSESEHTVTFEIEPKGYGEKKFTVSALPLSGEFSPRNNALTFFIKIEKGKKKALVITGLADPEVSAVRSVLQSNQNLEASFYTLKDANSFLLQQLDLSKHTDSDVCILIGFPNSVASQALLEKVHQFLNTNHLPVFCILTQQSSASELKRFEDLLPVKVGTSKNLIENAGAYASSSGLSSPIFKGISSDLEELLKQSPPMLYPDMGFVPKENATVLWKLAINSTKTERPVFVIGKTPSQKIATFSGIRFWQFWLSQDEKQKRIYEQTIINTIQWLTTKDDIEHFRVEPLSKNFEASENIAFSAILQDEMLQPVSNGEIGLRVKKQKSGEEFRTQFSPSQEAGFYKANFESLPEGDYTYTAEAKENDKQLGLVSGLFSVSKSDIEFRTPNADAETLREIARRSGGKFYTSASFPNFFADIKKDMSFQPVETEEKKSFELANLTTTLFIIVGLLTVEWTLRKIKALP